MSGRRSFPSRVSLPCKAGIISIFLVAFSMAVNCGCCPRHFYSKYRYWSPRQTCNESKSVRLSFCRG